MKIYDLVPPETIPDIAKEDLGYQLLLVAHAYAQEHGGMVGRNTVVSLDSPHGEPERVPFQLRRRLEPVLNEAVHWLETEGLLVPAPGANGTNGYRVLSREAHEVVGQGSIAPYVRATAFPRGLLHPAIAARVWMALARGDFDTAVFQAFKAVEEAVREAGGFANRDIGTDLMRKAFDPTNGPLTDQSHPEAERQALAHLFAGAIGSYKNPHSHRTVVIEDVAEAQEQVMLASHLLRIVDSRRKPRGGRP